MIKIQTIAIIASLLLFSCGGSDTEDTTPPRIKILSPTENSSVIMGNNIELLIEISDDNILDNIAPKAVFNYITSLKNVDEDLKTWTLTYPDRGETIEIGNLEKTEEGYKYSVSVNIPTKSNNEHYNPEGKYKLEVWEAEDRAGNIVERDSAAVVSFNIIEPPL